MAIFQKSPHKRMPHEMSGGKKFLIVCLVILLAAGVLGAFWLLSQLGPRNVDFRNFDYSIEVPESVKALQQESIELEARFEEVLALREAGPEDIKLLERALNKQEAYLAAIQGVDSEGYQRQVALKERYQNLAAESLRAESLELERTAERLAESEDYEGARAQYRAAYQLQKQINENLPLSSAYNVGRAAHLERQARYLTAEPLYQRSLALEVEADQFMAAKEWGAAEEHLRQAMDLQDRLNREYRGTNQASVARLERLRIKLVGIRSGQSNVEVQRISQLADEARLGNQNREAAALYLEAARLQRQLNEAYRDSPFASSERVSEYLRKSQTAESYELGLEIEQNHDLMQRLLSERRTYEAAEVIATLRRDIQQMQEAFPRSSLNNEDLQLKVRYLNLVQNDLGFVQDRIYDALLPIPDGDGWRMLRTEVPQALYAQIMGTNPSRNKGDLRPVDSVSWVEAKSFCERLSWILGKSVRLPTENEFRQALGRLRYVVLEDHVWSVADSDGAPQAVGTKEAFASGFYDLLGNASEWLESIDRYETEDARHIGGHAQDRLESIFTVPIREAPRGERNRLTGFRVVVNVDSL
ncbi:SUMF1/EgtB/PvdO family nonheme iron enzyme [Coraliomargarita sp. SDUM461004]|uniref:SUMF1/EgtB/PvdO family nonheme iron enzyme n=1 Tax=Thalassobacterium sedimentorum TaxID=3041258 RepID=A0ABU1AHW2_9BACT|nr:SUMF1/EgtB/PvdO family nonheme iron enzyme [Coraliomargarita sp. SDUM461004]MDQ8194324.1 SUMF1/EgtB/PvdO family nonheme iron enzyme [Coraliomargarita sp. SDUM461004]